MRIITPEGDHGESLHVRRVPLDATARRQLKTTATERDMALVKIDGETRDWTGWYDVADLREEV